MKFFLNAIFLVAATSIILPAWAVNKCTAADGKVVFQDAPCASGKAETLKVRPASGSSQTAAQPEQAASAAKPMSEVQKIDAQVAASQRARRKQDYEFQFVPNAQSAIARQNQACDNELAALRAKKSSANNNLAGATWEASISSEMTAVATRCSTKATELREALANTLKECRALDGCSGIN